MKIVCIYHSIDLDGWMSAAIVKHWHFTKPNEKIKSGYQGTTIPIDDIDFIGYNYGQPIPDLLEYDKVIMCDISFPKEEMWKLYNKFHKNFIWIDHHISAIKDITHWEGNKPIVFEEGIRDIEFAACELTWKYFFPDKTMPEIVRLLGRYDCFGHKFTKEDSNRLDTLCDVRDNSVTEQRHLYQEELDNLIKKKNEEQKVLEFQYGARQCITNYEEAYNYLINTVEVFHINDIEKYDKNTKYLSVIQEQGKMIYSYLCTEAKQVYKNGFEVQFQENTKVDINDYPEIDGIKFRKFICINKERFNPINFGIDYHKDGYDGCACFHYADGMWNFSLYNDNGLVDCSIIAKQFGGGGHKGAAGFKVNDINRIIK